MQAWGPAPLHALQLASHRMQFATDGLGKAPVVHWQAPGVAEREARGKHVRQEELEAAEQLRQLEWQATQAPLEDRKANDKQAQVLEDKEARVLSQEVQLVGRFVHSLQLAEHCTQLADV